jgi:hypothetical protein
MDILAVGSASEAGSELFRLGSIIAFNTNDPIVFDLQFKWTSTAAIESRSRPDNMFLVLILVDTAVTHFSSWD